MSLWTLPVATPSLPVAIVPVLLLGAVSAAPAAGAKRPITKAEARKVMSEQKVSDLLSRKRVKVGVDLLPALGDGATPTVARIWTERKSKAGECEHEEACTMVDRREFLLLLLERGPDGEVAIRHHSRLADAGLGAAVGEAEPPKCPAPLRR